MNTINGISGNEAIERFKSLLASMDDAEFFCTLGTSIEELKLKQELDVPRLISSFNILESKDILINDSFINNSFIYLKSDIFSVKEYTYSLASLCNVFEGQQILAAA